MPTILPGQLINPNVDPAGTERYVPSSPPPARAVGVSAFPPERRFTTIYPGTRASDEATAAAFHQARLHDRASSSRFLDVLAGRPDSEANPDSEADSDGVASVEPPKVPPRL